MPRQAFTQRNTLLIAPSLALLLGVDILVNGQAIRVLGLALLGRVGRSVIAKAPVLRELADAEQALGLLVTLPPAAGAILAALLVDVCALVVLLLAGISASIAAA